MRMIRKPAVAGTFYPAGATALKKQLQRFMSEETPKVDALGVISPHAGYIYSGAVAGSCFSKIVFKENFIILGTNHTGLGAPFSIMTEASWRTPLGDVEIATSLAKEILNKSSYLKDEAASHIQEHSNKVQSPF